MQEGDFAAGIGEACGSGTEDEGTRRQVVGGAEGFWQLGANHQDSVWEKDGVRREREWEAPEAPARDIDRFRASVEQFNELDRISSVIVHLVDLDSGRIGAREMFLAGAVQSPDPLVVRRAGTVTEPVPVSCQGSVGGGRGEKDFSAPLGHGEIDGEQCARSEDGARCKSGDLGVFGDIAEPPPGNVGGFLAYILQGDGVGA